MFRDARKPAGGVSRRSFLAGSAAVGISLTGLPRMALGDDEAKLNFFNWDTYIGPDTLENFEGKTGIQVQMDLYSNNAELFGKLKGGNPGYDIIVPTNNWLERMIEADMIMPLDHAKIPNIENIEKRFMDPSFDPGRKHSLPYMWGTVGVGYRKSRFQETPTSWKWLYDSDTYSGRISLLRDCRLYTGCGNKYLGYSLNTLDEQELKETEQLIIDQKPHLKTFAPDTGQRLLISRSVDITMEWSGDIAQVMKEDPDLDYVIPDEGGIVWEDVLAIPKGAPHPDNAHRFINYIHSPEAHAAIADFIRYGSPNAAARKHLPDDYLNSKVVFPPQDKLDKSEFIRYLGEDGIQTYEQMCTRILAA
jgi:spermidine/putrescine transport system substrate-binding protein